MARMPGAQWMPIPVNHTSGGMSTIYGVTLHIMDGSFAGTDSWFRNPEAEASSHFGTSKSGQLRQWVDSRDKAWAQADGNPHWLSIENEGRGGDTLTNAQLDDCARVLAWAHQQHGVPLQATSSKTGRGLGHHSMGGSAWGGHTACPGALVIAQKGEIIARATRILGAPSAPPAKPSEPAKAPAFPGRLLSYPPSTTGADVYAWQAQMRDREWDLIPDGVYGPRSAEACKAFQRDSTDHGWPLDADGIVGPATWRAAFERPAS